MIRIIGGGLAGSEAAWQAAARGVPVALHEMRPVRTTAVHRTDRLAELVCSNSFRGVALDNAVGLLKEEMRRLDSLVMRVADASRVPAGGALAVDRERFAQGITGAIEREPLITVHRGEVPRLPTASDPASPVIVATGPLTSESLAADLTAFVGREQLYFFDAISPIVEASTIDRSKVFRASRRGRGSLGEAPGRPACGADPGEGDYLNCPMTEAEYIRFHGAVTTAERAELHDLDRTPFFEGCLPIEVMAHRGLDTLRFGPMKPVGLTDPRTGRRPWAVVQLRQDDVAADHFSLVGFQTQLKWGGQKRVLQLIPGLEEAEFVRFGMLHRNTYINAPAVPAAHLADADPVRSVHRRTGLGRRGVRRVGRLRPDRGTKRGDAGAGRGAALPAAQHRPRRAGVLRLACRSAHLPTHEHRVRTDPAARCAAPRAAGAAPGDGPPRPGRSGHLDARERTSR